MGSADSRPGENLTKKVVAQVCESIAKKNPPSLLEEAWTWHSGAVAKQARNWPVESLSSRVELEGGSFRGRRVAGLSGRSQGG
jgi:hypothetical protein